MKRRNVLKDDEAVSPVIATILMVAITVVLAATLYMMLPGAEDTDRDLLGTATIGDRSTSNGYVRVDLGGLSPSSFNIEDVTVRLYDTNDSVAFTLDGEEGDRDDFDEGVYSVAWARTDGETIDSTARIYVDYDDTADGYDFSGYEIEITTEGTSGAINREL